MRSAWPVRDVAEPVQQAHPLGVAQQRAHARPRGPDQVHPDAVRDEPLGQPDQLAHAAVG